MQPLRAVGGVPSPSLGLVVLVVVINVVPYGIRGGGMSLGSDYTKSFRTKLSISKLTLPWTVWTALDSTGQLSQSPSSPNKVPNCQNLDSLSQHCDRLSQSVPEASTMTGCPRHTQYKGLALASLSLAPLPLALAQLGSV